jgi:NAD(P)-dependent dehydrogenase (short-subunit alcohol dehydrogenase family)
MRAGHGQGSGRVVLVTGASSGIGRATAARFARDGFRVFGTSRTPEQVEPSEGVEFVRLDVTDAESVAQCVSDVTDRSGQIDVLVNNAGHALIGESEATSLRQARAQFETNLFGVIAMTNAVVPGMRRHRSGRIINIGSLAGLMGIPLMPLYSASKFALEGYSEALRYELRHLGIRVSLIEPGWVATSIGAGSDRAGAPLADYDQVRAPAADAIRTAIAKGMQPERVAEAVARAATDRSPRLRYRVGSQATWAPRARAMPPAGVFESVVRRMFKLDSAEAPIGGARHVKGVGG